MEWWSETISGQMVNTSCSWCGLIESTDHIFFECPVVVFTWRLINIALNAMVIPKKNTNTMFGVWLDKFVKKEKKLTIAGCATVLWDLWRARNEVCFTERCFIDPANALFCVAFGWNNGADYRQRCKERCWRPEVTASEDRLKASSVVPSDERPWTDGS